MQIALTETGILPKENFISLTSLDTGCIRANAQAAFVYFTSIMKCTPHTLLLEKIFALSADSELVVWGCRKCNSLLTFNLKNGNFEAL